MPIKPENVDRYPKEWPEVSLRIRRDRAQWQCECEGECGRGHQARCHARHGHRSERGTIIILTVAHLNHTPEDCTDSNLKAMCQACHLSYDREHHAQTAAATRKEGKAIGDMFGDDK